MEIQIEAAKGATFSSELGSSCLAEQGLCPLSSDVGQSICKGALLIYNGVSRSFLLAELADK